MEEKLLFSVIVPVYNVEKYIDACIESIQRQSYKNWELILVDDGSTDRSGQICEQYEKEDKRIRLFKKENSGQADSRNYGIRQATGDYMIFVDSDDYIATDALLRFYDSCMKWDMPDVIIAEGMFEVFGEEIGGYHNWESKDYPGLSGRDTLVKTMQVEPNWSPCDKCYRLAFWREHGFLFPTRRLAEDFALIDKVVLEAEKVTMVPAYYYYRRFRKGSTMTKKNGKLKYDELLNLLDWEAYLKEKGYVEDEELTTSFRKIFVLLYCHDVLANMFLFEGEQKKEAFEKAKQLTYLLDYATRRDEKLVRIMVKVIGLKATSYLLGLVKQWKVNRERRRHHV